MAVPGCHLPAVSRPATLPPGRSGSPATAGDGPITATGGRAMWDAFTREAGGRGTASLVAFVLGWISGRLLARWRRMRQRRLILRGDARDTVIIEHHIVEPASGPDPDSPDARAQCRASSGSGAGPGGARPGSSPTATSPPSSSPALEGDPAAHLDLHGGGRGVVPARDPHRVRRRPRRRPLGVRPRPVRHGPLPRAQRAPPARLLR